MKKIISLILCAAIMLTGCSTVENADSQISFYNSQTTVSQSSEVPAESISEITDWEDVDVQYDSLDDKLLLAHIEDSIYSEAVRNLSSEQYFVENVSAVYLSKEYLEEVAYNSQSNIYFGYTLAELNDLFQGTKYVFTLGEDGKTTVKELVEIQDTTNEEILKNVAIGTGVILICVTVSVVTGGAGAPAISAIFAASAKTGAMMAISSAAIGGISAGVIRGIETGDMNEALEAAALAGSDGFKWGAISGAISGGANQAIALKGATLNGLTMNEAALIQKESGFPLDVIKQFKNIEQYNICKNAGLVPKMVKGKTALIRSIDLNHIDDLGRTNLERMRAGLAAIDPATGKSYQLHHIGQKADSTLAILTEAEHMKGGNNTIWHDVSKATEVHGTGNSWDAQRQMFWQSLAKILGG